MWTGECKVTLPWQIIVPYPKYPKGTTNNFIVSQFPWSLAAFSRNWMCIAELQPTSHTGVLSLGAASHWDARIGNATFPYQLSKSLVIHCLTHLKKIVLLAEIYTRTPVHADVYQTSWIWRTSLLVVSNTCIHRCCITSGESQMPHNFCTMKAKEAMDASWLSCTNVCLSSTCTGRLMLRQNFGLYTFWSF
jgi:hypothetical protein